MEYNTNITTDEAIAITIGNFDGIHRGHQRLMQELRTMAQELQCQPVLVTFSPHTLIVVRPEIDVQCLTTLDEKLALAKQYSAIEKHIVIHFTPEVMAMSATDFMDSLLSRFSIRGLVVGANFSLGRNRMGDIAFLEQYGKEHSIRIQAVPLETTEQTRISSTRIRMLVNEGQVEEANELLGHVLTLSGTVIHGDHRGRLLGFPTANVHPEPHKLFPANGVYAVRVHLGEIANSDSNITSPVFKGVTNIGVRPTFNGKERLVETHLLDTELDLYEQRISIEFIARLRSEQRFANIEALKAQIATDVQLARQVLK